MTNNLDETGGAAFPSHGSMGEVVCEGMTLQDYFAAKAMQGFAADPSSHRLYADMDEMAASAYAVAAAMLKARQA